MHRCCLVLLTVLPLAACDSSVPNMPVQPGEAMSGGATTVARQDERAFRMPLANLEPERRLDFAVGNSFFRSPWVIAPSTTTARDGLGPLFNTNACQNCHINDGRGHPASMDDTNAVSMLVRISLPDAAGPPETLATLGVVPEPTYGTQLQDMAIPGVPPEGRARLEWQSSTIAFADGHTVELRAPRLHIDRLGYGALHRDTQFSVRIAPPMVGLGLLEAIPESAIRANADPEDKNGDGISGRPNEVWDLTEQRTRLGRFGWKAGQPSLNQQNAHAFSNDMGLTTTLLPHDECTERQVECRQAPNGGEPEVADNILASVLFYTRNVAVPQRRDVANPKVLAGKTLFHQAGCAGCHTPSFRTGLDAAQPELANQLIWPYTDLLLHDMGEGLADGRSEFQATGREWRTPPLWGIGLTEIIGGRSEFLHDGRARTLLEAILWHGGEATWARDRVLTFDAEQRAALLAFLQSL
ncbi:di-heme oxidoreductase family protein [Pseudomonas sp. Marseille-QA0892]